MAKKSRRVRKKGRQVRLSPTQIAQPTAPATAAPQTGPAAAAGATSQAPDLQEEYRYVIADLKRIGIIAVVMLALLIALALSLT